MATHMQFNLPEHEKLVQCPYNKAHQVVQHRLAKHIIKCKRSHGGHGFKDCRFNSSHVYPIDEIDEHEKICPERYGMEVYALAQAKIEQNIDSGISSCMSVGSAMVEGEDWSDLPPVPSYNPKKKCMNSNILVHIQHGTPSERRRLRDEENERLEGMRSEILPDESRDF